jgi:D-lyxose ketol-isomerase
MKRSEINTILREASEFLSEHGAALPPWAGWSPQEWERNREAASSVLHCGMGWDVTDFGSGEFASTGLTAFTVRNGSGESPAVRPYCEKLMVVREGQVTPTHHHKKKREDIICRGGGNLVIRLWNAQPDESVDETGEVHCMVDDIERVVPPGGEVVLQPGMSIFLRPDMYHLFFGEVGSGTVLVGEISTTNDDEHDNFFAHAEGRFPGIEEDEPPLRLLVSDYARLGLA